MSIAEKILRAKADVDEVYEAGKAQRDYEWWDRYQNWFDTNDMSDWLYAFAGPCWTDDLYNPIRPLKATSRSMNMYTLSNITDTKVPITLGTQVNCVYTFQNALNLVTIRLLIVTEGVNMSDQFNGCKNLQHLTIEGTIGKNCNTQWCPLTKASIENVVSCLSDTASGLTCTFNKAAKEAAFTDDEWTALTNTKKNWSFGLV